MKPHKPQKPAAAAVAVAAPQPSPALMAVDRLMIFGPLVMFLGGAVFGMLGLHSSTDNWIAIGTGRYIIETGKVPTTDPFSYTFQDKPFFNQNWLSHVVFYLLYEHVGPEAIVFFTWGMNVAIYAMIAIAIRLRTGSWFAGMLTAGTVAACARHLYDTRPQTVSYVCFGLLGLLFHIYLRPRERENLWTAAFFFPLLLIWSNAHGSFILAYVLVAAFVILWVLATWLRVPLLSRAPLPATPRETAVIATSAVLAFILTVAFGPYGFSNFTHSFVVQESPLWKQVAEWNPPWVIANAGLPTIGFWIAVIIGGTALVVTLALHLAVRRREVGGDSVLLIGSWAALVVAVLFMVIALGLWSQVAPAVQAAQKSGAVRAFWLVVMVDILALAAFVALRVVATQTGKGSAAELPSRITPVTVFDGVLFAVGLYFALQSRRFAALFFVLSTPVATHWLCAMGAQLDELIRRPGRRVLALAGGGCGVVLAVFAGRWAWRDLVEVYRPKPQYNLLERYIMYDETNPVESIKFLGQLDQPFNVFAQWTVSGILFGRIPNARVFMDGRAQQVYSEQHYITFNSFFFDPNPKRDWGLRMLDDTKTEFVALRPTGDAQAILTALLADQNWIPIIVVQREVLMMRRGTPAARRLAELTRENKITWPAGAHSLIAQAELAIQDTPPDVDRAISLLQRAAEVDLNDGPKAYGALTRLWLRGGRQREGLAYYEAERQRVASLPVTPAEEQRQRAVLGHIDAQIAQLRGSPPGP
jgi:hypothetical protein